MRILYIPLDERPCNAIYPVTTAEGASEIEVVSLPTALMGAKKQAPTQKKSGIFFKPTLLMRIMRYFQLEMLLYGGLLPSRLHHLTQNDLAEYEQKLRLLKRRYPEKKIFLSNLIMRTPRYNSSDEEPDYYEEYGERIFALVG